MLVLPEKNNKASLIQVLSELCVNYYFYKHDNWSKLNYKVLNYYTVLVKCYICKSTNITYPYVANSG